MTENPWELYTQPGWKRASNSIAAAVERGKKKIDALVKKNKYRLEPDDLAYKVWREVVSPVLDRYVDFGALDSEPAYHTRHRLVSYARKACEAGRSYY